MAGLQPVTDPNILQQLEGGQPGFRPVTDPETLKALNSDETITPDYNPMQFFYGFNEGLANIYDLPQQAFDEVYEAGKSLVTGQPLKEPIPHRDMLSQFLRNTPPAQGPAEQATRTVGGVLGQNVPMAAASLVAAPAIAAGPVLETTAGRALQGLSQAITRSPAIATAGEAASSLGQGAGAALSEKLYPGNPWSSMAFQVAGGFVPGAWMTVSPNVPGTPMFFGKWGKRLYDRLSPAGQTAAAQRAVSETIGPTLNPDAQARLAEAQNVAKVIPGYQPSLAEATGSPALVATQRAFERDASGPQLEELTQRRIVNRQAVENFATQSAPQGTPSPSMVYDAASRQVQDLTGQVEQQAAGVQGQRQDLAASLPQANLPLTGQSLRERMQVLREQARQDMNARADALGINGADVTYDWLQLRDNLLEIGQPKSGFEDIGNFPEVLDTVRRVGGEAGSPNEAMLRQIRGEEPTVAQQDHVTFADIKALRERLGDDLQDAQFSASPNRKKIRVLAQLKKEVDGFFDEQGGKLSEDWAQFRQEYKEGYIDRFEQGAAFRARQRDGQGYYKTSDEDVAGSFFEAGNESAAQQFNRTFGADPEAHASMNNAILDDFRNATVRDGTIQPGLASNWMRQHETVLRHFPEAQARLGTVTTAQDALMTRQAQLTARQTQIGDTALAREVGAVSRGRKTPEQAIDGAIRDPRLMQQLVNSVRSNPDALAALRRHIWDDVAPRTGADLENFLNTNRESLAQVFTAQHVENLRVIARARQMNETTPPPAGKPFEPNSMAGIESQIGMGVPQAFSRLFAWQSGRIGWRFVGVDALARFLRNKEITTGRQLLYSALFNPEVAQDLASLTRFRTPPPQIAHRLNTWLFTVGMERPEEQR